MIKLLIVDDSALMRRHLRMLFEAEGDFEIKTARNGKEAIEENINFQPDVITLDINMPVMDGLTALSMIMAQRPVPVVMVSSLTEKGALATFEALNLGAVDYVAKPEGTISLSIDKIHEDLISKVRAAVEAKLKKPVGFHRIEEKINHRKILKLHTPSRKVVTEGLVLIGVSTGGPRTLEEVLRELPADYPFPILVAQHMPKSFTRHFSERLDSICAMSVLEVNAPVPAEPGKIYIARGGGDMVVTRRSGKLILIPKPEDPAFLWHPSVEVLGRSAIMQYEPSKVIGVMLTGMGHDGADAFTEIKKLGGRTIAESEESAVVFGMPAELIRRGGATLVLPAEKIAKQLVKWAEE